MNVITNNTPRHLLDWHDLTDKEKKEFDYIKDVDNEGFARFVRYKGWVYDMHDVERVSTVDSPLHEWDGFVSDSFFSGVVFKYTNDYESVVCGRYCC